ncbi:uncharacterized protein [Gorilla gorilla gorilla]|uniref:uncharacterized protein n=1 Tax=Gorilla gorilla gorilla TaxID=9595 RepID=UPI0024456FD3|nr:uncharacterized protein LOC129531989 [Gorilla gorilla gorilla]
MLKTSQIGCGLLTAATKEKTDAKPFINCKTVYNVCYYSQLSYCDQTLYKPAASQPYSQEVDNIWGRRSSRIFQDSSLDSLRPREPQQDRPGGATEGSPIPVLTVPTAPYEDQRPAGGGGLRRPTGLFEGQRSYLPDFIQSVLSSIDLRDRRGCTMVVGSDGRCFSRTAIEIVVQMAAANGVSVRMPLASRRAVAMPSPSPCPPAASGPSWEAPARRRLCYLAPASSPSSAPLPPRSQPPRRTPDTGFY